MFIVFEKDGNDRSNVHSAVYMNRPVMQMDKLLGNGEPEARSGRWIFVFVPL